MRLWRRLRAIRLRCQRRTWRFRTWAPSRTARRIFVFNFIGIAVLFCGVVLVDRTPSFLIQTELRSLKDRGHLFVSQVISMESPGKHQSAGTVEKLVEIPDPSSVDSNVPLDMSTPLPIRLPDSDELQALLARLPGLTPTRVQLHDTDFRLVADASHQLIRSGSLPVADGSEGFLLRIGSGVESALLAPLAELLARQRARSAKPDLPGGIAYRVESGGTGPPIPPRGGEASSGFAVLTVARNRPIHLSVTLPLAHLHRIEGFITVSEHPSDLGPLLRQADIRLLWIFLISVLLCIGLSATLASTIARPLARLAAHATAISLSGGSSRLADSWPESSGHTDEINQLSAALQGLTRSLIRRSDRAMQVAEWIAHELRQPTYAIIAASDSLRKRLDRGRESGELSDPLAGRFDPGITVISNASDRMNNLVTEISKFSKLEVDLAQKPLEEFDICREARTVLDEMAAAARAEDVKLVGELPPSPVIAVGETQNLQRAMINLVQNAISFSPKGGTVTLRVSAGAETARVVVDDEGPGIPESRRKEVFDAFYKDRREKDRDAHSGLGLSIVREIVAHARGRVWIEDAPSGPMGYGGARFVIELHSSLASQLYSH